MSDRPTDATQLLRRARRGDARAADELMPLVYDQLRRLAQRLLVAAERPGHTLQATALVNEAYLKLVDQSRAGWNDHLHFLAVAAQAIRRILVDHARSRGRRKRGGDRERLRLRTDLGGRGSDEGLDLVELDDLLEALEARTPRAARVVELRFFGGLTVEQVAELMDLSVSTVEREWRFARAWLFRTLVGEDAEGARED